MLGRGRVQNDAIAEVLALPLQSQRRTELLRLLVGLKITIETTPEIVDADQELMMALSQAYLEWEQATEQRGIQKGRQEGMQEGERSLILRQLNRRLGTIPAEAQSQIQTLSLEQLEVLGEVLLDFSTLTDLETWLQQC
jgi:predicted transposase YdaD